MTESLDPRRQQMIAALYGELSPEEDREFRESLRTDADLRAEWEELRGTRSLLGEWALPDAEPRFVFVDQPAKTARRPAAPPRLSFWQRLTGLLPAPAWGFAAVSLVLAGLMLAGFRVDRVSGGLAFRFGTEAEGPVLLAGHNLGGTPAVSLDSASRPGMPVSQTLTPATLDAYSADIMGAVMAMLQEYQDEQNAQLAFILNGFYEELRAEGRRDYRDLETRLEGVGFRLLAEQNRTNARIENLIDKGNGVPLGDSPPNQHEEQ